MHINSYLEVSTFIVIDHCNQNEKEGGRKKENGRVIERKKVKQERKKEMRRKGKNILSLSTIHKFASNSNPINLIHRPKDF